MENNNEEKHGYGGPPPPAPPRLYRSHAMMCSCSVCGDPFQAHLSRTLSHMCIVCGEHFQNNQPFAWFVFGEPTTLVELTNSRSADATHVQFEPPCPDAICLGRYMRVLPLLIAIQ